MSMLGSPNLARGNAPLGMRLKIDDLRAQLAPMDRYGVGEISSAIDGWRSRTCQRPQERAAGRSLIAARIDAIAKRSER